MKKRWFTLVEIIVVVIIIGIIGTTSIYKWVKTASENSAQKEGRALHKAKRMMVLK